MPFIPAHEKPVILRLLLALAGPTGSGKTYSALEIAAGVCGKNPCALIDTENGRALHYRADFNFDHDDLQPPFRPGAYTAKVKEATDAGYGAIIIDSGSHEHAGEGGLLDWHEEELQRMAKDDWKKRERCAMAAWIKPKMAHKAFVHALLRQPAQLIIVCLRAERKTKPVKDPQTGKMVPTDVGFKMITEKTLPYEFTAALMMRDPEDGGQPGTYDVVKCTKHLLPVFDGKLITRDLGQRLVAWSQGGSHQPKPSKKAQKALDEIAKAKSKKAFGELGGKLKAMKLTGQDHATATVAYQKKSAELGIEKAG